MSIKFSDELYSVIFLASSNMVDVTSMCMCPCGSTSTTSQSTSLLYHSTSGGIISPGSSDRSSQIFYNATTDGNNTIRVSPSLGSSLCYCPCSPAASTPHMACKYVCQAKRKSLKVKFLGELKIFILTSAIYTWKNSSNAESFTFWLKT